MISQKIVQRELGRSVNVRFGDLSSPETKVYEEQAYKIINLTKQIADADDKYIRSLLRDLNKFGKESEFKKELEQIDKNLTGLIKAYDALSYKLGKMAKLH